MAKSHMGAKVQFCGHDGYFVADIFEIEGANVINANGEITPANLTRPVDNSVTHHVSDLPSAGFWGQHKGILVVPANQVRKLKED